MPLPLYYDSLDTARRQDDVMLWRNSFKENIRCKNAIEKALAENFDGMHLKDGIIPPLAEEYGTDRLTWVLANTVKEHMTVRFTTVSTVADRSHRTSSKDSTSRWSNPAVTSVIRSAG